MEILKNELAAIEQTIEEFEIEQLADLELVLVGGGNGIVLF